MADVFELYGYPLIFLAAVVEGDATLLTATFLARRGYFALDRVMLVAAAGTVSINQIYFAMGRRLGRSGTLTRPVFLRVIKWLHSYRTALIIGSRFVYGFRIAIPTACGASGTPWLRFTIADIAGSVIWVVLVGFAGYAIGHALELLFNDLRSHEWWVALALVLVGAIVVSRLGRDSLSHFKAPSLP